LILGLSARLTGGGFGFAGASRTSRVSLLNSPDLRGGGGEGGCEGCILGDLPGSKCGVLGLLGILKFLGDALPEDADNGESAWRYDGVPGSTRFNVFALGGDCGGWIITAGGTVETGRGLIFLVGEGDILADAVRGGFSPFSTFSLPRAARRASPKPTSSGCTDAGLTISLEPLLTPFPVGCGEISFGPGGGGGLALRLAICSKWDRKEDTGLIEEPSRLSAGGSSMVRLLTPRRLIQGQIACPFVI